MDVSSRLTLHSGGATIVSSSRRQEVRSLPVMSNPQGGIFAVGTASHAYLEFDRQNGGDASSFVRAISSLREPRTTMGGVNLVAGFRPELWHAVAPEDAPD